MLLKYCSETTMKNAISGRVVSSSTSCSQDSLHSLERLTKTYSSVSPRQHTHSKYHSLGKYPWRLRIWWWGCSKKIKTRDCLLKGVSDIHGYRKSLRDLESATLHYWRRWTTWQHSKYHQHNLDAIRTAIRDLDVHSECANNKVREKADVQNLQPVRQRQQRLNKSGGIDGWLQKCDSLTAI